MKKSKVLIDTSFLLTMLNTERENHEKAKELFKYFVDEKMRILLSTIVLSEYAMMNDVENLLKQYDFEIIIFSLAHAKKAKEVNFIKYKKTTGIGRVCLKDDFKILGQCIIENVDYFAFEDNNLNNFIIRDRAQLGINFKNLHVPDGKAKHFGGTQGALFL